MPRACGQCMGAESAELPDFPGQSASPGCRVHRLARLRKLPYRPVFPKVRLRVQTACWSVRSLCSSQSVLAGRRLIAGSSERVAIPCSPKHHVASTTEGTDWTGDLAPLLLKHRSAANAPFPPNCLFSLAAGRLLMFTISDTDVRMTRHISAPPASVRNKRMVRGSTR